MAVIKVKHTLAPDYYTIAQYTSTSGIDLVTVSGYPAAGRVSCEAYDSCYQYASVGKLNVALTGGVYTSNKISWCGGHSGSAVARTSIGLYTDTSRVVGENACCL
jgi:V8-like Glu-specific endopeptidase